MESGANTRTELSDLLRELEQGASSVRRNATSVKDALYGSSPEPSNDKSPDNPNTAVGVLRMALTNIGRANDELVFLKDSCNLGLKGSQAGQATRDPSMVPVSSRY
jgi:hypothetical protein